MWIDNNISYPTKGGVYRTLVDIDDLNTLVEQDGKFEGGDWCHYESARQYVRYWWATEEDYKEVLKQFIDELD